MNKKSVAVCNIPIIMKKFEEALGEKADDEDEASEVNSDINLDSGEIPTPDGPDEDTSSEIPYEQDYQDQDPNSDTSSEKDGDEVEDNAKPC